jgi:hypothetical protein
MCQAEKAPWVWPQRLSRTLKPPPAVGDPAALQTWRTNPGRGNGGAMRFPFSQPAGASLVRPEVAAGPPGLVLIFLPFLPSFQEKPFGGKASPRVAPERTRRSRRSLDQKTLWNQKTPASRPRGEPAGCWPALPDRDRVDRPLHSPLPRRVGGRWRAVPNSRESYFQPMAANSGAAARMAKIERATAPAHG